MRLSDRKKQSVLLILLLALGCLAVGLRELRESP